MQHVVSAMVGTTASGRPRYSGCNCCSTDAKKLFRSMCRKPKRSGWSAVDTRGCQDYIRFLFALNHIVGDAERIAKVERIRVFPEDDAAIFQQRLFGRREVRNREA